MSINRKDMEVINRLLSEITSERKWYMVCPDEKVQVRLRMTASRIRKGKASPKSVRNFFSLFGHKVIIESRVILS